MFPCLFGLTLLWTLLLFCNTENWGLGDFIRNGWKGLFGTFSYLDTPFSDVAAALKAEEKQKENGKGHYILIGLVIGIPLLMVVAALLLSADAVFASLVSRFFGELAWSDFITVFLMLVLVYLFAYGFIRGLLTKSLTGKRRECLGEPLAAITVLSLLTAIYTVFCAIQIVYLFLRAGTLPEQMTWAQYARQGFFQLLAVCGINLGVVAVCLFGFRKNRALQVLLTAVCAMTYVLIASSAWRMYLYIRQYSLTFPFTKEKWPLLDSETLKEERITQEEGGIYVSKFTLNEPAHKVFEAGYEESEIDLRVEFELLPDGKWYVVDCYTGWYGYDLPGIDAGM